MNMQPFLAVVRAHYHRLLAAAAIAACLGVGGYVGWRTPRLKAGEREFDAELGAKKPRHPRAAPVDMTPYREARERLDRPIQLGSWSNSVLVPPTRVWCVDCQRPIPYDAAVCSGCGKQQPVDPGSRKDRDEDRDGMHDVWEEAHGLNPRDPSDRDKDPDDDGFTNYEEFIEQPGTDPTDPNSHPPIGRKLCVADVRAEPFPLLFKSVITLPEGGVQFVLNSRESAKTYFVKLGDTVEGFVIETCEERFVKETQHGAVITVNRSVLTLRKGEKTIALEMGKTQPYTEMRVVLRLTLDGSEFVLKEGDLFKVKDKDYRLIRIDTKGGSALLQRLSTQDEFKVGRCGGTAAQGSAESGVGRKP